VVFVLLFLLIWTITVLSPDIIYFGLILIGAGALAGLLAGLFGVGGGAVLVPVFFQAFGAWGVDPSIVMHVSVGTSLAIIVPTSIRSFLTHKNHGAVDFDVLKKWVIAVPFGVFIASFVAAYASGEMLRLIFACIAILIAFRMLFNRPEWQLARDLPTGLVRSMVGVVIGLLSALMGIGGGVLNNTFMTLFNRPMHQAVATSSGVGVLISIPGLIGYIWAGWGQAALPAFSTGFVNWPTVLLIIPVTLFLAPIGARLAHKMDKRQLEIGFGIFLIIVALRFFISLL
jgi:uncharacterized membrane protein YfcA